MKHVLGYIEKKKKEFEDLPFFDYMQDANLSTEQKLSFAPVLTHWVMTFADINKYVLRDKKSTDRIQKIINTRTEENDHHFLMFLHDLKELTGGKAGFADSLGMLWGEGNERTRRLSYGLIAMISAQEPVLRLPIIEMIEATGNVAFSQWRGIAEKFQEETGRELRYFGNEHPGLKSGHAMETEDTEESLKTIKLNDEQLSQALLLVDKTHQLFAEMVEDLTLAVR